MIRLLFFLVFLTQFTYTMQAEKSRAPSLKEMCLQKASQQDLVFLLRAEGVLPADLKDELRAKLWKDGQYLKSLIFTPSYFIVYLLHELNNYSSFLENIMSLFAKKGVKNIFLNQHGMALYNYDDSVCFLDIERHNIFYLRKKYKDLTLIDWSYDGSLVALYESNGLVEVRDREGKCCCSFNIIPWVKEIRLNYSVLLSIHEEYESEIITYWDLPDGSKANQIKFQKSVGTSKSSTTILKASEVDNFIRVLETKHQMA